MKDQGAENHDHRRNGVFRKVGENLYRYSSSGIYYAVFRANGKLNWKSLKTADRELTKRKLTEEQDKSGRIDPVAEKKTIAELLQDYEKNLQQYDAKTVKTRKWILQTFKEHGLTASRHL